MSAPQPEPRSRPAGQESVTPAQARPTGFATASTSGDGPRPHLPPTRTGAVVFPALTGTDLYDWIALRRVSDGGMAALGDCWLEHGHRIPGYVTDALIRLRKDGLIAVAAPDPMAGGLARVARTDTGTVRYQQLCQQRQKAP